MAIIKTTCVTLLLFILSGIGFIYSGFYPIGADQRHHPITLWVLTTLREQSIARASRDLEVPPLDDPALLLSGGADYNEMCSSCHLKPGKANSDLSLGLYPQPPNLTLKPEAHDHSHGKGGHNDPDVNARRQFWVIKHGIMASGMAAFGSTHDDGRIWAIVAFLQKLPQLNELQYQIITARRTSNHNPN